MGNKISSKWVRVAFEQQSMTASGPGPISRSANIVRLYRSRIAENVPFYRNKIAKNESATGSLTAYEDSLSYVHGNMEVIGVYPTNKGKTASSNMFGLPIGILSDNPNSVVISDAQNAAAIGIRNKITDTRQAFSGMTFLGELRQSIQMIRNPALLLRKKTGDFLMHAGKIYRAAPKRRRGAILSDMWLEFSFGVQPLVADINGIAEASLRRVYESAVVRLSYTGVAASSTSSLVSTSVGSLPIACKFDEFTTYSVKHIYTVGLMRTVSRSNSALERVVENGGFNLQNVIPTAWELLPWSWFIDYFSNIGDVISASLSSTEGVKWVNSSSVRTLTQRYALVQTTQTGNFNIFTILKVDKPLYSRTRRDVVRVAGGIPTPEVRFELPGRPGQIFNLGALARLRYSSN